VKHDTHDTDRTLLDAVLECLIPPDPDRGIPSAAAFGVAALIDSARAEDPTLDRSVDRLLERIGRRAEAPTEELLRQVEHELPADFETLLRLTYVGYYGQARARPLFGLSERPVHPHGYAVEAESAALLEELTAPVRARGPVYRDPDGAARDAGGERESRSGQRDRTAPGEPTEPTGGPGEGGAPEREGRA